MSKTRASNIQMQAHWSSRGWSTTLAVLFDLMLDEQVLRKLGLLDTCSDEKAKLEQMETAEFFTDLLVRTAGKRAWSYHSEIPPQSWAALLHDEPALRQRGFLNMREEEAVITAAHHQLDAGDQDEA